MIENKKTSILLILNVLKLYSDEQHFLTQQDIIDKVDELYGIKIERKSVAYSISLLQELDFDINKGVKGGYALFSRNLDKAEVRFLIDSVFSSKVINGKQAKRLANNLMNNLSVYQRKSYNFLYKTPEINRSNNEEIFLTLDTIEEAIKANKRIGFQYLDYDKKGKEVLRMNGYQYIVSPYYLINNFGRYYLLCNYREKYRALQIFRIDYIKNVVIKDDWNIKPLHSLKEYKDKNFSITSYINEHIYMLGGESIEAEILIENQNAIRYVKDWFGKNAKKVKSNSKDIIYKIRCNETAFIYWVMQYGEDIKVLSPDGLIDKILETADKSFKKYKRKKK